MARNARVRRGQNRVALRGIGILIGVTLAYGTSSTGFNYMIAGTVDLVKGEMKKFQGRPGPYSDPRNQMRARTSPVGRDLVHRGGVRTAKDVADLMRAEQVRLERFNQRHPENLSANITPTPQMPPFPDPVGEPEEGEGVGGGDTGVAFSDRHEGGAFVPKSVEFTDDTEWCIWKIDGITLGRPCMLPGGDGGGTGGGTGGASGGGGGGGGLGGGVESRVGLNTNTGNLVTAVPITGWSARGDSYVDFTLIHNSMYTQELGAVTDIGHSWSHSYSIEVNYLNPMGSWPPQNGDKAYLIWMDGQRIQFTYNGVIEAGAWARFDPPPGYHANVYYQGGGTYKLETKDQWTYWFNGDGYLTAQDDPWGNRITINRNDGGNEITTVNDGTGRSLTFTYANGKITSVMAPDLQQVWSFELDIMNNDLIKVTYPTLDNNLYDIDFVYNGFHDITTFTNKLNKSWTYDYGPDSELTSATNPLDKMWSITYQENKVTILSPEWGFVEHHYQDGRMIAYRDESGYFVNFWADSDENLTQVVDKRDQSWNWTYDSQGNVLTFKDPLLRTWTYTYNADNNLTSVKDPQTNTVITIGYDNGAGVDLPAPTEIDNPVYSATYIITYDQVKGEVISTGIDYGPLEEVLTTFTYDGYGNVLTATANTGVTASATYDVMGRPDTVTDAAGELTQIFYDDWGRPESLQSPDFSTVMLSINEGGQVVSATDQLGRSGFVTYNDAGYAVSATNAKSETTTFDYDDIGRLKSVTNARNKTRWYFYTARHQLWYITLPDGNSEYWGYDGNGNVTGYWPYLGATPTNYTYDDSGGQTGVDYPTGVDTTFGYDAVGRWNSMADATGTSSWVQNLAGQVTSLTTPEGSSTYTYSADLGQPNTMVDSSGTWTALYDQYHRSVGMTNPWAETTTVSFDSAGRVDRKNLPNDMYETYQFDNRSRPEYIRTYNSGGVLQDTKSYSWDAASRVMQAVEGGVTTSYDYDYIDQLISEVKVSLNYYASYTYDANGNRLTRTINQSTETYAYDDADKLLSIVGGPNPRTYTYDSQGGTKTILDGSGTTAFTYDYDGRATAIQYPGATSDNFGYNGLGARMTASGVNGSKTFRRAGLGVTSVVLSDGTKEYTPGVSSRENGVSTFQHSGLKNAMDQTDSNENVTASRHYDAFGNLINSSGTWEGPFGYGGSFGYQEDGNGLKLLGHRYYDSDIGRFVTSDPIASGRNWYVYLGGRPVAGADPSGLDGFGTAIGGIINSVGKMPFFQRYGTDEEAAFAALEFLYGKSVEDEIERGGWIIEEQTVDGPPFYRPTFIPDQKFAPPGRPDSKYQKWFGRPPAGAVASYHTHPAQPSKPGMPFEIPIASHSTGDKENARRRQFNSYVVGYNHMVYKYDGVTQQLTRVRKIVRGE